MNYTTYTEKKFNIPELKGISSKTIEEHLKLYAGYVKHTNLILTKIAELSKTPEEAAANVYMIGELRRRLGFEFGGMRNHEYYFEQFEGGFQKTDGTAMEKKIIEQWGSTEAWLTEFQQLAMTRGVGWAMLYRDDTTGNLVNAWVGEQHDGHLPGLTLLFALDMWEHSYMLDVPPSEKKKYVEAFFANVNWDTVAGRYK
ncbi:MAG: hypothetical protein RJB39_301 [Candidatus Parcubacteria bacterium]|jgi:Fe-Mn family superoxide dismutase